MNSKKAREGLKLCKKPTRKWLEQLRNPTDALAEKMGKTHLKKHLEEAGAHNKNYWGLLQTVYSYHAYFINYVRKANDIRKNPLPIEYNSDVDGFIEFVLDTGIPPKGMEDPCLDLRDKKKGYIPGNFVWTEKSEIVRSKTGKSTARKHKPTAIEKRKCIVYHCQNYYLRPNTETEYEWQLSREDLIDKGLRADNPGRIQRKLLRQEVWVNNYGAVPSRASVIYKDPKGDLTDPRNVELSFPDEAAASYYRTQQLKQAMADITAGYLKVCLGCYASWRIIDNRVLWEREPSKREDLIGPCEKSHENAKKMKIWKDRFLLNIPHATVRKALPWTAGMFYANFEDIDDSDAYKEGSDF